MTILLSPEKVASIDAQGLTNNPIIAFDNLATTDIMNTGVGTPLKTAQYAVTGATFDSWVAEPDGGQAALQATFAQPTSISFVSIAAHNLGDLDGAARVQYRDGGGSWVDAGAGPETPADNQAIAWAFKAVTASQWRILFFNIVSGNISVAVAFFGNNIILPQRIYQGYAPPITPNRVELQSNVSEGNQILGSTAVRKASMATASLTHIKPEFIRSITWKAFQRHHASGRGFFWAWRPSKYGDLFYGVRTGAVIAPTNSGPKDFMSFDISMRLYHE